MTRMVKELEERTIFEDNIPTPAGHEHIAATDPIASAVEGIMDTIQASVAGDAPAEATKSVSSKEKR